MITIPVYNQEGSKVEDLKVSEKVFGLAANDALVHQAYVAISGNQRTAIAHTKDRGERSGSGKKPWAQKGTGNARAGSVRSPIWRKGGIIFGPTKERNFTKDVPKKMNQKAIKIVLSQKNKNQELLVVDSLALAEKKTKAFQAMLKNLKIGKKVLIAFMPEEKLFEKMSRNIPAAKNTVTANVNVFDMLNNKYLLMSKASMEYIGKKYADK